MNADLVTVQVRDQFRYDGATRRKREVLQVSAEVAEYLIEAKRAKAVESEHAKT